MRKVIAAALIAGAVAAPASLVASGPGKQPEKPKKAKKAPVVNMVFSGVVQADAAADGVVVKPLRKRSNIHARRAVVGVSEMTVKLSDATRLRGFILNAEGKRVFTRETVADLKAGDRVMFVIRAKKGTVAADLPAARWMRDFTGLVTPVEDPSDDDDTTTTTTTETTETTETETTPTV